MEISRQCQCFIDVYRLSHQNTLNYGQKKETENLNKIPHEVNIFCNFFLFCCVDYNLIISVESCIMCKEWQSVPPVRRRNQFHQLSPFERGRIIGLREARFSYRQITAQVNQGGSVALLSSMVWRRKREPRVPGSGRRRNTTAAQGRYLRILALSDRHNSTRWAGDEWFGVEGRSIHISWY
jgi:hypothetical protein